MGERAAKQSSVITVEVIRIESRGKTEFLLVQSAVLDEEELGKKQSKIRRKPSLEKKLKCCHVDKRACYIVL